MLDPTDPATQQAMGKTARASLFSPSVTPHPKPLTPERYLSHEPAMAVMSESSMLTAVRSHGRRSHVLTTRR